MLKIIPNIRVNYRIKDILSACFITCGKNSFTLLLTQKLKELFEGECVILTSSGRSALYHILAFLPQHKVIVPAYTCDVVVEAALLAGKEVNYAHINRETLNMNEFPDIDSDCIVIATHQYGFPCDIKTFCAECEQKKTVVIEDCAGAFGLQIDGQMAGTFGNYAIFSFNASKLINAPASGGFLIAKNESDLKALKENIHFKPCTFKYKVKSLCKGLAFCMDKNSFLHYWLSKVTRHDASKAHLSAEQYKPNQKKLEDYFYGFYNWQAYVVLKQLKKLPSLLRKREELNKAYQTSLNHRFQRENYDRQDCSIRYPVYMKERERFRQRVRSKGIEIGFGFEHFVCPDEYKNEVGLASEITYLPFSSNFTEKEIKSIIKVLNQESDEQGFNS